MALLNVAVDMPRFKIDGAKYKVPELDEPGAVDFAKQLIAMAAAGNDCSSEWIAAIRSFFTSNVANMTTKSPNVFGKRQAFPALRRMILAQLVKAWVTRMQRQLPGQIEEGLQQMFLELYEAHRVVAIRKGIMEYFHISKAGGTSWCHAAKNNGCRAQIYDSAYICQISQFDDRVRWLNNNFHVRRTGRGARWGSWGRAKRVTNLTSCAQRHEFAALMGYQYFSNEYTLHEGFEDPANVGICHQFFNVILIRHPHKRLLSHLKFVVLQMKWDYRNNDLFNRTFWGTDSEFWDQFGPVLVDNYMLRGMLGETVYHAPIGSLGAEEIARARAILQQYDLIIDLEEGHDAVDQLIELGVGWPHTLREIHDKDSVKAAQRLNLTYDPYLPRDLDFLYDRQAPDMEWYNFGRVLVRLDELLMSVVAALGAKPLPSLDLRELHGNPRAIHCGLFRRGPRLPGSSDERWMPNDFFSKVTAEMLAARQAAAAKAAARAKAVRAAKEAAAAAAQGQGMQAAGGRGLQGLDLGGEGEGRGGGGHSLTHPPSHPPARAPNLTTSTKEEGVQGLECSECMCLGSSTYCNMQNMFLCS
ncbi:hypothetical protein VOLCADRAFT_104117 [Volvox carteri f. nagariensis]|uniref:Sulfotransferase n=1 Tax=Volvox carteri f. nagariensis TaxID=3068 RepID=D8TRC3_VOLCA|nr:uncharacterized protein VOLCADRAFT_104117 [Volvox carteri f. nagariensis]EFJ49867.1 hypothetical protein VOLCADRAFT_104117 [Volvox carteri f. nagariensis]|eukprot:XP_002948932.1 hypothetical protein VOLCADRAFT_104117 [Volvox carteri f. nagariensis]